MSILHDFSMHKECCSTSFVTKNRTRKIKYFRNILLFWYSKKNIIWDKFYEKLDLSSKKCTKIQKYFRTF